MAPLDTTTMAENDAGRFRPGLSQPSAEDDTGRCQPGLGQQTATSGRGHRQPPSKTLTELLSRAAISGMDRDMPNRVTAARRLDQLQISATDVAPAVLGSTGNPERPTVGVWLQRAGRVRLRQGERIAELGAGDLCLVRGARPLGVELPVDGRVALVEVPEQAIADRFKLWRFALMQTIPADTGAPAVFSDAVRSINRWQDALQPAMGGSIACAVVDLIGAMICFVAPLNPDCVGRALLQQERVRRVAREHLRDPALTVEKIAAAVGLSARQIHRLFADQPLPLMRWIWTQRLEQCYRELRDASARDRSIAEIAYAWGFNDQAHFSRAFRKHFGITPRAARMQTGACH